MILERRLQDEEPFVRMEERDNAWMDRVEGREPSERLAAA